MNIGVVVLNRAAAPILILHKNVWLCLVWYLNGKLMVSILTSLPINGILMT